MFGNVNDMNLKMEQEGVLRVRIPQCLVLDLSPLGKLQGYSKYEHRLETNSDVIHYKQTDW